MAEPSGRRVLKDFVPPILWRAMRGLHRARQGGQRTLDRGHDVVPLGVPPWGPKGLNYVTGDPIFVVPIDRIRYPSGRRYSIDEHHFLQYYRDGLPELRRFYERHQPANVFEAHFLRTPVGKSPPPTELPWFMEFVLTPSKGDGGLGPEHGDQAHGPVSERKLRLEAARLDAVLASIRVHGFRPDRGGYPRGYFMVSSRGEWVFTIREGFHRVAALAHLGYESIRVGFAFRLPRFVDEADVADWPAVRSGGMSANHALAVFSQYFRDPGPPAIAPEAPTYAFDASPPADDHRGSSNA